MSARSAIFLILVVLMVGALFVGRMRRHPPRHVRHRTSSLLHRIDRSVHDFDRLVARETGQSK